MADEPLCEHRWGPEWAGVFTRAICGWPADHPMHTARRRGRASHDFVPPPAEVEVCASGDDCPPGYALHEGACVKLKLCANCRGTGEDCTDCDGRGVGVPVVRPHAEVERCGHPQCEMPAGSFRIDGLRLCERCYGVASRQVLSAADILSLAPADPQPEREMTEDEAFAAYWGASSRADEYQETVARQAWKARGVYEAGRRGR
jgi:hypothetical protein